MDHILSIDPAVKNAGLIVYHSKSKSVVHVEKVSFNASNKLTLVRSVFSMLSRICRDYCISLIIIEAQIKFCSNPSRNILPNNEIEVAIMMFGCVNDIQLESIPPTQSINYLETKFGLPASFKCKSKNAYAIKKAKAESYFKDLINGNFSGQVSIRVEAKEQASKYKKMDDIGDAFCQLHKYF